jgi:hypothetical protein
MSHSPTIAGSLPKCDAQHWPRLVAWLAVVAHVCVADVIGVSSKTLGDPSHGASMARDSAVLLAQADLLVVWLVLGGSRWVRRLPWSLCGLAGVGLVIYARNLNEVVVLGAYVAHALTTVGTVGFLRFRRMRITRHAENEATEETRRSRRQFTILDLFAAALAIAIAVSWVLRVQPQTSMFDDARVLATLAIGVAPLSAFALLAAIGMRRERWLAVQIVFSASVAIFLTNLVDHQIGKNVLILYSVHWFLVAATLWIFQMCGFRLVRFRDAETDGAIAR